MRRAWVVARREYLASVRTRTFFVALFLTPVLMALLAVVPLVVQERSGPAEVTIAVWDATGEVFPALAEHALAHNLRPGSRTRFRLEQVAAGGRPAAEIERALAARARAGALAGYVVIGAGTIDGREGAVYATRNAALYEIPRALQGWLGEIATEARVRRSGLDPKVVERVCGAVPLRVTVVGEEGVPAGRPASVSDLPGGADAADLRDPIAAYVAPMVFFYFLFFGIFGGAQWCLTSLIEEKSSRIVEVVLASVPARDLMVGKIVGMGLVGLTVLAAWGGGTWAVAASQGLVRVVAPSSLAFLAAYMVLGYLLYASAFCAVGSACSTLKDAQNLMLPVTLLVFVPMAFLPALQRDPSGGLAIALSYVPPFTPFVMMIRLAASPRPGPLEIALSMVVLAAGVAVVMAAAARVFRVGILMYGKPPRLREIARWARRG